MPIVQEYKKEINKISTAIDPKIYRKICADIQNEETKINLCIMSYKKFVKECIKVRKENTEYVEKLEQYISDIESLFDVQFFKTNIVFKPKIINKLDNQVNNGPQNVIKKQESITKDFDNKEFEGQQAIDIKENKQFEDSILKPPVALNNRNKQKKNNQQILEENNELSSDIEVLTNETVLENVQRMFGRQKASATSLGNFEFHGAKIDVLITSEISQEMIEMDLKFRFECAVLAGVVKKDKSETGIKVLQFQDKKGNNIGVAEVKYNAVQYKLCEVKILGKGQRNGDWIIGNTRLVCLWDTSTNTIHGFEITNHDGVSKCVNAFRRKPEIFIENAIPKQEQIVEETKQIQNEKLAYQAKKEQENKDKFRAAEIAYQTPKQEEKKTQSGPDAGTVSWTQYPTVIKTKKEESKRLTDGNNVKRLEEIKKNNKERNGMVRK